MWSLVNCAKKLELYSCVMKSPQSCNKEFQQELTSMFKDIILMHREDTVGEVMLSSKGFSQEDIAVIHLK